MSEPAFDVFLCHNSHDKPAVKKIAEQLRERGLRPWLDVWELQPGLPWQRTLEAQIPSIGAAAIFVGTEGRGPWQEFEIEAFIRQFVNRGCPVIPVILPTCQEVPELPVFLEGMTYVDFRLEDPDPLDQLVWGITGDRPESEDPGTTPPATDPQVSISHLPVTGEQFVGRTGSAGGPDQGPGGPGSDPRAGGKEPGTVRDHDAGAGGRHRGTRGDDRGGSRPAAAGGGRGTAASAGSRGCGRGKNNHPVGQAPPVDSPGNSRVASEASLLAQKSIP